MDLGTAFGLLLGLGLISIGIISNNGDPMWFLDGDSLLIVLGGTFAATLVNYPLRDIQGLLNILSVAFKKHILNHAAVELAINEKDPARLRSYLELELGNVERRHSLGQEIFLYMGAYAPAFGMLGTVLGLIIMMTNFAESQTGAVVGFEFNVADRFADLLGGMGLALITTFYGVLLSNLVFLPLAGKLKRNSEEELMIKDIMVEGIIGIHAKDHPLSLREKLMTFVPQSQRVEAQ